MFMCAHCIESLKIVFNINNVKNSFNFFYMKCMCKGFEIYRYDENYHENRKCGRISTIKMQILFKNLFIKVTI
jgi:hypothetical protein